MERLRSPLLISRVEHVFDPVPAFKAAEARTREVEARIAELQGIINAAHGELVTIAAEVIDTGLGLGTGVHTPALYLAWKAGISTARAHDLVRLAKRRDELPTCVAALADGSLTLDQAAEIARHVPAEFEADATAVGKLMTVRQLRTTLPNYAYHADKPKPGPDPAGGPAGGPADDPQPKAKPEPITPERFVSMGTDERGWWMRACLPEDEGAVVQAAIEAMRDDLFRQRTALLPKGESASVNAADGLVCAAEAALRAGEAAHPGTDRYQVHLHLEQGPNPAEGPILRRHLGARLPSWLHQLLLCDCSLRGVTEQHGTPLNVGRKTRIISRRTRRLIEHRDGGCAVPGCQATRGLEIHHIIHWEDLGPTDTWNLVALCHHHHRQHHLGTLGIAGNADLPRTEDGALTFSDRFGRTLESSGQPTPVRPGTAVRDAAQERDIPTQPYEPPLGERLSRRDFHLNSRPAPTEPASAKPASAETAEDVAEQIAPPHSWDHPDSDSAPNQAGIGQDPTRAGPVRAA